MNVFNMGTKSTYLSFNQHLTREKRSRPWLQNPKTDFNLQCREISREAQLHPSEAALATLPHYLHPALPMERSEVQAQYRNPFQVTTLAAEAFIALSISFLVQRVLQLGGDQHCPARGGSSATNMPSLVILHILQ